MNHIKTIAQELGLNEKAVEAAVNLIDEGNTIPFIARYRKEATGSMDDQVLRKLGERLDYLRGLEKRRDEVKRSIEEQGALTEELAQKLEAAETLARLEDLYRPYRPKRKTRASVARARGLASLAELLLAQNSGPAPEKAAAEYLSEEVPATAAALAGARDILAEQFSDDAALRQELRELYQRTALLASKAADAEKESVYEQYYDYAEPVSKVAGHRILAVDRGEREGFLKVSIQAEAEQAAALLRRRFVRAGGGPSAAQVTLAAQDAYDRLLHPSLERELRSELTARAAEGAIAVFGENLRQLLLQPPIRGKVALGMDPGYRMGCKLAVVDPTGKVLATDVVYPIPAFKKVEQAKAAVKHLIQKYGVQIIAIGNGTAGAETEQFAAQVISEIGGGVQYMVVSEAGASVYSASPLAAAEFLRPLGGVILGQGFHQALNDNTLWAVYHRLGGIQNLDPVLPQAGLVDDGVVAAAGEAVCFPADHSVEEVTVAVGDHLLERRAAVTLAGNVAVDILMDDLVAVGFGVGLTVPALAINALLGLLSAVGVAIVRHQPQSANLLQFLFARHKYHLSSSFKFVASRCKFWGK